jgi:deoxyribonuclease IV
MYNNLDTDTGRMEKGDIMLHIGYHESTVKGYTAMGSEALSVGADTFAFFTRNPRGGSAKPIDTADAAKLCLLMEKNKFAPLVAHAPYTMNPCSADPHLREYALAMMIDDLLRLEYTPGCYYNFHPGSHVGQGTEIGITLTAEMLAEALKQIDKKLTKNSTSCHTIILVETMAGKGSEIGKTFAEIRTILDRTAEKYGKSIEERVGVCLDTCHIWDGGYDIVNDLNGVLSQFDKEVGLNRIHAVHLNDSLNIRESHKDRHAIIGEGKIGADALSRVINHPALHKLPFILETPNDHDGYKKEIELMRSRYNG